MNGKRADFPSSLFMSYVSGSLVSLGTAVSHTFHTCGDFLFYRFYPFLSDTGLPAVFRVTRDDAYGLFYERFCGLYIVLVVETLGQESCQYITIYM